MHKYLLISLTILSIFLFGCGDRSSSPNPLLLADDVITQPLSELKEDVNVMLLVFGEENVSVNNDGDDRIEIPINALTKRVIEESIREAVNIKAITNKVIKTLKKEYAFNKNKAIGAITSESFVKTVLEEIPDGAILKNVDTEALVALVDEIMAGKTPVEKPVPEPEETQETSEDDQQQETEDDQQQEAEDDQQQEAEDDQQQEAEEDQQQKTEEDQQQEGVDAAPEGTSGSQEPQDTSGNNQVQPNTNTQPEPQPETQEDTDTDADTDTGTQQQDQNQQQQGNQDQQPENNDPPPIIITDVDETPNDPPFVPPDPPGNSQQQQGDPIQQQQVNNVPVFSDGSSTTRAITENTGSGENIGFPVSATDADGDTLTYTLGGTDASAFSIVSSSGQLETSAALDYETKSAYAVTVSVSDGNGGSDSITVTINVTDVDETPNDPPPQQSTNNNGNSNTNTPPATQNVRQPEPPTVTLSNPDNIDIRLSLNTNADGDIVVNNPNAGGSIANIYPPDLDEPPTPLHVTEWNPHYQYKVEGTDSGVFSIRQMSDDDQYATLSISSGLSNGRNYRITIRVESEGVSQIRLKSREELEKEITLESGHQQGNNAPVFTDGTSTTRKVEEGTGADRTIGAPVSATDADGDTLTYTLGGTHASSFDISPTKGQLLTKINLDHETKSSYSVTVSVSDGRGGSDSIAVTINVADVVEAGDKVTINVSLPTGITLAEAGYPISGSTITLDSGDIFTGTGHTVPIAYIQHSDGADVVYQYALSDYSGGRDSGLFTIVQWNQIIPHIGTDAVLMLTTGQLTRSSYSLIITKGSQGTYEAPAAGATPREPPAVPTSAFSVGDSGSASASVSGKRLDGNGDPIDGTSLPDVSGVPEADRNNYEYDIKFSLNVNIDGWERQGAYETKTYEDAQFRHVDATTPPPNAIFIIGDNYGKGDGDPVHPKTGSFTVFTYLADHYLDSEISLGSGTFKKDLGRGYKAVVTVTDVVITTTGGTGNPDTLSYTVKSVSGASAITREPN